MGAQARYWRELVEIKQDCFYLEAYLDQTEKLDRGLNIFLALTSSTAIAGWAIWRQIEFVWALLIAGAQVINAVKPWIPYSARLKPLRNLSAETCALAIIAESDRYAVSNGSLTEDDIQAKYIDLKSRKDKMTRSALGEVRLPEAKRLAEAAGVATAAYFLERYGV